ncbi:lysophospholipid acyltransferase family protein [Corynebacterium breve]|uniref:Lysophospholipid acyltransferase family protein n=1 Tax=Corynebacterium breve TaxID=3049799 RepID=A0ABY8VBI1_9CORY|nr:lysophospholipid acyltransferase family protein [Corynebacterium breve]WIM66991.1 lysophospholipid acyltransferase family protein [Corynebacterium breve]
MQNKWYWVFKHILLGPLIRVWNRPYLEGKENIPAEGPAIMASNHQAVYDSFIFPLVCPRQLTFPAKSEYFTTPGLIGGIQKWFFTTLGQVPVDRTAADAGDAMITAAKKVLDRGDLFGIYPEGTRSPDGRIYKGRTGMARIAMATGVDVVPVVMENLGKANPIGSWLIRPVRVGVKIGEPINPHKWAEENGFDPESREVIRPFTDFVVKKLAEISGNEYVDMYASDVKKSLEAGHGYPPEAQPKRD